MRFEWDVVIGSLIILIAASVFFVTSNMNTIQVYQEPVSLSPSIDPKELQIKTTCTGDCYECLLESIEQVESRGDCNALGDYKDGKPRACGPYQIRESYLEHAKRACDKNGDGTYGDYVEGAEICCSIKNWRQSDFCKVLNDDKLCQDREEKQELVIACHERWNTRNGDCSWDGSKLNKKEYTCSDLSLLHHYGPSWCTEHANDEDGYWNKVKKRMDESNSLACKACRGEVVAPDQFQEAEVGGDSGGFSR